MLCVFRIRGSMLDGCSSCVVQGAGVKELFLVCAGIADDINFRSRGYPFCAEFDRKLAVLLEDELTLRILVRKFARVEIDVDF